MKPKKSGTGRKNYINYIATRENVEKINRNENVEATEKQSEFIQKLVNDYREAKELLEYEDYKNNPTKQNATEFIDAVLDRISDICEDRELYIKYIAQRPRVDKATTHGLFSFDGVVQNLNEKAKEIADHKGVVWSHVLSLRREDAENLGFNNYQKFKTLIDENIVDIAKAHKIKIENLQYVCAFHNESHHPHCHLVIYSKDIKEGFLTEQAIETMRSRFANSIFRDEIYFNYGEQNKARDELRNLSKVQVNELLEKVRNSELNNEKVLLLIKVLHNKMKSHMVSERNPNTNGVSGFSERKLLKGSKTYKWFSKKGSEDIKNLIDEVAKEISKDENIIKLYDDWYVAVENRLKIYKNRMPERVPLYENQTFTTIHNHIINEVLKLDFSQPCEDFNNESYYEEQNDDWSYYEGMAESFVDEQQEAYSELENEYINSDYEYSNEDSSFDDFENSDVIPSETKLYVKWSKTYKEARKLLYNNNEVGNKEKAYELLLSEAKKGNILGIYDTALLNKNKVVCDENLDIDLEFSRALGGFEKLAETDSKLQNYFEYRIGKMYSLGFGAELDYEKAVEWFLKSTDKGNQYAQFSLGNCYFYGNGVDVDYTEAFEYYKLSADQNNIFASYKLGEMYGAGVGVEVDEYKSFEYYKKALNGFLKAVDQDIDVVVERSRPSSEGTSVSERNVLRSMHLKIANMFEKGLGTEIDLLKADKYYIKALDYTNDMPKYKLGKLYLSKAFKEVIKPEDLEAKVKLGVEYLESLVAEESDKTKFATYTLGKAYAFNKDVGIDIDKAKDYLKLSVELGNEYAEQLLNYINEFESKMLMQGYKSILGRVGGLIASNRNQEDVNLKQQNKNVGVDRKLMSKINEKKREQGLRF